MSHSGKRFPFSYLETQRRSILEALELVEKNGIIISIQMLKRGIGHFKKKSNSFLSFQHTDADGL